MTLSSHDCSGFSKGSGLGSCRCIPHPRKQKEILTSSPLGSVLGRLLGLSKLPLLGYGVRPLLYTLHPLGGGTDSLSQS